MNKTVIISGKLGDTIAAMASLYELHKKDGTKFHLLLNSTGDPSITPTCEPETMLQLGGQPMAFNRGACEFIKPLLEIQPYIESVEIIDRNSNISSIDINLDNFRAHYMDEEVRKRTGTNLEFLVKDMLGLPLVHTCQWLFNLHPRMLDRKACIARSCRYTSAHLWLACKLPSIKRDLFFVGTNLEYEVFREAFGIDIPHERVVNALELAELITGTGCFISNGTCAYWLALALNHPFIIHELGCDIWTTYYKNNPKVRYIQGGRCFT